MDTKDVVLEALDRIRNVLRRTLDGLTLEEIIANPVPIQFHCLAGLASDTRTGQRISGLAVGSGVDQPEVARHVSHGT